MIHTFHCPNCHASLDYNPDSHTATVRCDYCGSTIIVPESLRRDSRPSGLATAAAGQAQKLAEIAQLAQSGQKIQAIKLFRDTFHTGLKEAKDVVDAIERNEAVQLEDLTMVASTPAHFTTTSSPPRRGVTCLILAIVLVIGLGALIPLLVGGGLAFFTVSSVQTAAGTLASGISLLTTQLPAVMDTPTQPLAATATPGLAGVVWQMGGQEGIGPGFFNNTRRLGLDGAGNIYVLGTESIYKFDAGGRFVDQIGSRGEAADQFSTSVTAIAVDGQGRIFAEDFKGILVFDANGRYLGTIDFRGVAFDMIIDDRNELLVMDRNGNQVLRFAVNE